MLDFVLKADIGPFEEVSDEWGADSIVISNYGARIMAVSTEQSIRGIRHGQYRPDLVICDDIEDLNSVKTRDGRERTFFLAVKKGTARIQHSSIPET